MVSITVGLLVGWIVGMYLPWSIAMEYAPFSSVAIMACLDAVFGGWRSYLEGRYENVVFFSGFFVNALIAALLVFIGSKLGIDLYFVALMTFGFRIFTNSAVIRRIWLERRKRAS